MLQIQVHSHIRKEVETKNYFIQILILSGSHTLKKTMRPATNQGPSYHLPPGKPRCCSYDVNYVEYKRETALNQDNKTREINNGKYIR